MDLREVIAVQLSMGGSSALAAPASKRTELMPSACLRTVTYVCSPHSRYHCTVNSSAAVREMHSCGRLSNAVVAEEGGDGRGSDNSSNVERLCCLGPLRCLHISASRGVLRGISRPFSLRYGPVLLSVVRLQLSRSVAPQLRFSRLASKRAAPRRIYTEE